jgi:N6-L-threonylcarbamoyladenine synthase
MIVLGIETSCDETSAAVLKDGKVLSCHTLSSLKRHAEFGGVIPEIATREHAKGIDHVVKAAMHDAKVGIVDLDCVAATMGPGLVGALLVGASFAKAFAYAAALPFVAVDHLKAHIFSALLDRDVPAYPFIGLIVSGGHTQLYIVKGPEDFELIARTRDDAAGEALDKVGRFYGLPYPAAPHIDALFDATVVDPAMFRTQDLDGLDVSYSGIKTRAVYLHNQRAKTGAMDDAERKKVLSSFQYSVVETVISRLSAAIDKTGAKTVVCGGGVLANGYLRMRLSEVASSLGLTVVFPEKRYCGDNAAMVAMLGGLLFAQGKAHALSTPVYARGR